MLQKSGACAHYVMVSKFQWQPFWLATQLDPQNDWTEWQNRVNYDVCLRTQAPLALPSQMMGPVRIRHGSHGFGWQSSHSVDRAGWQAKMASIEIWIP